MQGFAQRQPAIGYKPSTDTHYKEVTQTHCALGKPALSVFDERRFKLYLLNNILGGPSMNSRLNMALREKHGLAYSIESVYQAFTDTGFIGIYYGTEEKAAAKARRIVLREIQKLGRENWAPCNFIWEKNKPLGRWPWLRKITPA